MPLITTKEEFVKYIILDSDIDISKLLIFSKKAEFKIKKLIGTAQYDEFVSMQTDNEVKDLFCTAVAQFGLLLSLPSLKLRINNSGIFTTETTNSRPSEWWEIRDLHRNLRNIASGSIDDALEIMEEDPGTYPLFIQSPNYTVIKGVIVTRAGIFQKYFNITNSRLTYLGLLPYLRECIDQYLAPWMGDCLNDIPDTDQGKKLRELLQKALVALTVAKAAETGSFSFENDTLVVKWEQLPWEKSEKVSKENLNDLKSSRLNAGLHYLSQAKKLISENPADFPCYQDINKKPDPVILVRKSGLFLS